MLIRAWHTDKFKGMKHSSLVKQLFHLSRKCSNKDFLKFLNESELLHAEKYDLSINDIGLMSRSFANLLIYNDSYWSRLQSLYLFTKHENPSVSGLTGLYCGFSRYSNHKNNLSHEVIDSLHQQIEAKKDIMELSELSAIFFSFSLIQKPPSNELVEKIAKVITNKIDYLDGAALSAVVIAAGRLNYYPEYFWVMLQRKFIMELIDSSLQISTLSTMLIAYVGSPVNDPRLWMLAERYFIAEEQALNTKQSKAIINAYSRAQAGSPALWELLERKFLTQMKDWSTDKLVSGARAIILARGRSDELESKLYEVLRTHSDQFAKLSTESLRRLLWLLTTGIVQDEELIQATCTAFGTVINQIDVSDPRNFLFSATYFLEVQPEELWPACESVLIRRMKHFLLKQPDVRRSLLVDLIKVMVYVAESGLGSEEYWEIYSQLQEEVYLPKATFEYMHIPQMLSVISRKFSRDRHLYERIDNLFATKGSQMMKILGSDIQFVRMLTESLTLAPSPGMQKFLTLNRGRIVYITLEWPKRFHRSFAGILVLAHMGLLGNTCNRQLFDELTTIALLALNFFETSERKPLIDEGLQALAYVMCPSGQNAEIQLPTLTKFREKLVEISTDNVVTEENEVEDHKDPSDGEEELADDESNS